MKSSRSRSILLVIALVGKVAALDAASAVHRPSASSLCRSPDDRSAAMLAKLRQILTDTGSEAASYRTRWGLSDADSANLSLVRDSVVCSRARRAIDGGSVAQYPGLPLHLVRVNDRRYAIADTQMVHHYAYFVLTDSAFRILNAVAY